MRRLNVALVLALPLVHVAQCKSLNRCDACFVVYDSLEKVLELEHLDEDKTDILAGGRLDSKGVRQGNTIKYATSEFRTSHLLDQVCEMASTFRPRKDGYWVQNKTLAERFATNLAGKTNRPLPKLSKVTNEREEQRMALLNYCDNLVEEHEDDLAELIKSDAVDERGRASLCKDVVKSCKTDKAYDTSAKDKVEALEDTKDDAASEAAVDDEAAPKKKKKRKKKKQAKTDDL